MIEFTVTGTKESWNAAEWCINNFESKDWEMELLHRWGEFKFKFRYPEQATLFALTWAN